MLVSPCNVYLQYGIDIVVVVIDPIILSAFECSKVCVDVGLNAKEYSDVIYITKRGKGERREKYGI